MDALTLLALQIDWGADEALAEAPVNRLVARPAVPAPASVPVPPSVRPSALPPRPAVATQIHAGTLAEWRAVVRDFTGCALRVTATNPVLAEGDPAGGLLVIGDPPGAEDDRSGRPFSGAAGAVLDRILPAIGLDRDMVLLAPLIPWRPPGNRPPTDAELAQCLPLLHRLIVLGAPRRIVLSGIQPVRALLGAGASLRRVRGRWAELRVPGLENPVPALPTYSLANLKTATERRDAWADWRLLRRHINEGTP